MPFGMEMKFLEKNYVDWHTDTGDCGVTLMSTLGDYDIVITKRA